MQSARYAPAAAVNGRLYAIGGANNNVVLATVEEYDPLANTWSNRASMNQMRYGHQAVVLNGKIHALGGRASATSDAPLASVEEYDPVLNTWTSKADMPSPRVSFGVTVVNGKIYVVGGRINNTPLAPVYAFDPLSNSWTTNASIPTTRETPGVTAINGRILAMGGTSAGAVVRDTAEEFDPTSDSWSVRVGLPKPRNECFAVVIGDALYVFVGYNDYTMQATVVPPLLYAYTAIKLEFFAKTGRVYQVMASPDLVTWTNFGPVIPGDGNYWSKTYSTRGSRRLFYRVEFAP
jgi:N-acetylneuraminic acid mutarotase